MIATYCYGTLEDFAKAHRDEIDAAARRAEGRAAQFVWGLPPELDRGAFFGEAVATAWPAAITYDPGCGVPYSTKAAEAVEDALRAELRRQDPVSQRRRRALRSGLVGTTPQDLRPLSLDAPVGRDEAEGAAWLADPRPGPEDLALRRAAVERLWEEVGRLPERQREAIVRRYLAGEPLAVIAEHLGSTVARASQVVKEGLNRLNTRVRVLGPFPGDF